MLSSATVTPAQVKFAGTQFNIAGNTLSSPSGVAVDGKGNVYIADRGNNRIVSVAPSTNGNGAIATVLSGLSAPSAVAADWAGNLYIADTGNNRILLMPVTRGGLGGPVQVGTGFSNPAGVAIDSTENIYVADSGNNRIVELPRIGNSYGSAVQLVAGLSNPTGIAVDAAKNIYIADTGNNRVLKVMNSTVGYLTQQALGKALSGPMGVAVDANYNVYIADTGNNRIVQEPWFAGGKRYNAQSVVGSDVAAPAAVVRDWDGNVYVADLGNNQVLEVVTGSVNFGALNVASGNSIQTYNFNISAGTIIAGVSVYTQGATGKDFTDAKSGTCISQTYDVATACGVDVAFQPTGSGTRMGAIVLYDGQGNALATTFVSGNGLLAKAAYMPGTRILLGSELSAPSGVAVDGYGNVFIADTGNNRVLQIPNTGNGYGAQSTIPVARLDSPMGLAVDGAGNLYVVSNGNDTILKLPWLGSGFGPQSKVGANFYGPTGITVDTGGNVYIADTLDQFVFRLPWSGNNFTQAQHLGGYVKCPLGVAVDASGNVYFTMPYFNSIQQIPLIDNRYVGQFKTPQIKASLPSALAMDGNANLYVLDTGNNRVLMLPWNGTGYGNQITVADGFSAPSGLAVDMDGNLYVADTGNNQVVKIDLSTPQPLIFSDTYLGSTSADSSQLVRVDNAGNQPLTFSNISYATDFPANQQSPIACSGSTVLSPGAACQFAVDFTPKAAGAPLNEAVSVQFEGAVNQQSIALSGTSIGKLAQTIAAPTVADVPYGTASVALSATSSSGLPVAYQVIAGPAVLNRAGSALTINGTGLVVLQAMQAGTSTYAAATTVTMSFQVLPAVLTVTPVNVTATYGSVPSAFTYTVTGFISGQSASKVLSGAAMVKSSSGAAPGAGIYSLTATQGTLSAANYTFVYIPGTLTVNSASLVVNADSFSSIYGAKLNKLTYTVTGFVNGDSVSAINGAPALTCECLANAQSPVGKYPVTVALGTLNSANYSFTFSAGVVNILPAQLTVTANSASFVYGQSIPQMGYTTTGFLNGDTVSNATTGSPAMATLATARANAGTYTVTPTVGTMRAPNYTFTFVAGVVTVSKAVLTVKPIDASMTYGSHPPALSYSISGFVGADTRATSVAGTPQISASVDANTTPETAAITATSGSLTARNYTFIFQTGKITINKAVLSVQIKSASMIYGSKQPALTYQITGFVNDDSLSTVSGIPAISLPGSSSSSVGSYPITGTIGSLASSRYSFVFIAAKLTVSKATLNVIPNPLTMTYGSALPSFTYTVTGFAHADGPGVLRGKPVFKTIATAHTHAGAYAIQAEGGSLAATNYNFTFGSATLVIGKAPLIVVPDSATMVYGAKLPSFTYTVTGLVNGDKSQVISGAPAFTSNVAANSPVGSYIVHGSLGTLAAQDYSFQVGNGQIALVKAMLTVTPNAVSMTYGSILPKLTYSVTGFTNGDTIRCVGGNAAVTTTASTKSPAGGYSLAVDVASLSAKNYSFTAAKGVLTINKAILTVTPNAVSMTYGATVPTIAASFTGFVNGDTQASAITGAPRITTNAKSRPAVGSYQTTAAIGTLVSANYSFQLQSGTMTVTAAPLTVTANSLSIKAGDPVPALSYTLSGLVDGDKASSATTGTPTLSTTATTASPAGTYPIAVIAGTMQSANYMLTFVEGTLTVNSQ